MAADYDGDGLTDIAVYRPSEGNWYILKSSGGTTVTGWKADIGVFRPSLGGWYIINSGGAPATSAFSLGMTGDSPVALSYIPTP